MPVALGLVIANSGSMRNNLGRVLASALALVRDSNRHDEVFIVNFNDNAYLDNPKDKDFTNDIAELESGLIQFTSPVDGSIPRRSSVNCGIPSADPVARFPARSVRSGS